MIDNWVAYKGKILAVWCQTTFLCWCSCCPKPRLWAVWSCGICISSIFVNWGIWVFLSVFYLYLWSWSICIFISILSVFVKLRYLHFYQCFICVSELRYLYFHQYFFCICELRYLYFNQYFICICELRYLYFYQCIIRICEFSAWEYLERHPPTWREQGWMWNWGPEP